MKKTVCVLLMSGVLALAGPLKASAEEYILQLDPASCHLSFLLEATGHDVQGDLALTEGQIRFDPESGESAGRIVLDATSSATGSKGRDKTMHQDVLLSNRFPTIDFVIEKIGGQLDPAQGGDVSLTGNVTLAGTEHPLTVPASVQIEGRTVRASGQVEIPFVAWGLHDPSFLFLRVGKVVKVNLVVEGSLVPAA